MTVLYTFEFPEQGFHNRNSFRFVRDWPVIVFLEHFTAPPEVSIVDIKSCPFFLIVEIGNSGFHSEILIHI